MILDMQTVNHLNVDMPSDPLNVIGMTKCLHDYWHVNILFLGVIFKQINSELVQCLHII